jgi:DUF2934 family protein
MVEIERQEQEIRERAYLNWERAGKPTDRSLDFWLDAEREQLDQSAEESDQAQEASEESFPASDPSANTPITSVGPHFKKDARIISKKHQ